MTVHLYTENDAEISVIVSNNVIALRWQLVNCQCAGEGSRSRTPRSTGTQY